MSQNEDSRFAAAQLDQAVHAAFVAEGYVDEHGVRDLSKVRERMFEVLLGAGKVISPAERKSKAVTRGTLVERVFPSAPGEDAFDKQEDPQLAQAVWVKLAQFLWNETRPNARQALQRLVGVNMGNGYVLCRTKVGKDSTPAAYITDNRACIEHDFIAPDSQALQRKHDAVEANREMLILRQPQNAARYAKQYDQLVKAVQAAGHDRLAMAVAAVKPGVFTGDDDDDGIDAGSTEN